MAFIGKRHRTLDKNGVGKCSVPMWRNGMPAGFCDKPAFGNQIPSETFRDRDGRRRRTDGKYEGYVPALACPAHGGPPAPFVDIVFDAPPGPESGRFVEVENAMGESINAGEWIKRKDGYFALRINLPAP